MTHESPAPPKTDQELANEVNAKMKEFNAAVQDAYKAGLRVELKLETEHPIHSLGREPYILRVKMFKLIQTFKEI